MLIFVLVRSRIAFKATLSRPRNPLLEIAWLYKSSFLIGIKALINIVATKEEPGGCLYD